MLDISKVAAIMPKNMRHLGLKLETSAPEIMVIAGAGMVVGAAIVACKQTIKAHDILAKAEEDLKKVKYAEDITPEEEYSAEDIRSDKVTIYAKTALDLGKTYIVPVALGLAGLGLMLGAHKILHDRNAALTLAYSGLVNTYNAYREKVIEAIGEEKEFALRSGMVKQDVTYLDEAEKEKTAKNAKVIGEDGTVYSMYARIFDDSCVNWSRNPVANLTFLRAQQNFANDKLRAEGHLFLNDVYQMLGFPKVPEGQLVGWIWDPDNADTDSYVDFGIYDKIFRSPAKRDFINTYEPCVWLDFNVDGVVYDLI